MQLNCTRNGKPFTGRGFLAFLENRCLTTGTRKPRLNKPLRISSKTTIPSWLAPYLRSSDHDQRSHRSIGHSSAAAGVVD